MTQAEIKNDIAELKATIAVTEDKAELEMLNEGLKELEAQLEDSKDEPTTASKMKVKKTKAKNHKKVKKAKPIAKPQPKTKLKILKKALKTQVPQKEIGRDEPSGASPVKKKLVIVKDKKQEEHIIETAFGKDIKDAVLVLNKERFKIREIKDRKTGKTEQVKHTIEYKNAKTIQRHVNSVFDSAIY
jgi:hypothetical protein